ncbi:MAG: FHA domain-containing protein [Akkermansia sp.]|nr:FHA domain-containing protein [Akkermansia sp.]
MNQNNMDPHQRKATPLFKAGQFGHAGSPKTLPFGGTGRANNTPEPVTMPMPGAGATVPLITPLTPPSMGSLPGLSTIPPRREALGPVAGWLVIISGPGRGHSLEIGYGYNSIGRSPENEVCLPFNDTAISDKGHAYLAYDSEGHMSYVTHGQSRNMVYLDHKPVLGSVEITHGSVLRIGKTELMYVPFCTPEMNWSTFPETSE